MVRPLCFMVMPYGKKPTQAEAGVGVPDIDFNALWDKAFLPTIQALGYDAVRADQDTGSLIVTQMIERIYFADLVLADMTIPNGNVYYEVGVRQAAKKDGCVLLAAEWSKRLFDVQQMRSVTYPLADGAVGAAAAEAVRTAIQGKIEAMRWGVSPVHDSIKGYPDNVDEAAASTMKDRMIQTAAFQGDIRAVRALPLAARMARAKDLADANLRPPLMAVTALAILLLLRDCADVTADWDWISETIARLPAEILGLDEVREIEAFALGNAGRPLDAIARLEALMATGPTPERCGILGGRYKRLAAKAATPAEKQINLARSIAAYEQGMELDLNEYYCSSNLPRLYRQRGRKGDDEKARAVSNLVAAACDRALKRGTADEWVRATLLGAAFDAGDCDKAEELADKVAEEGAARWKLESTLSDLQASVPLVSDPACRARLSATLALLKQAGG